ncbi:hypothetical protein TWF718_009725 [Orbilia javanica]|uniref:Uncharacterized protein n=1 Tax=Orbilia javanica TaxID=47235 RepID=A0AAN8MTX1_9PEZI
MALAELRREPDTRNLPRDGSLGFDWYYKVSPSTHIGKFDGYPYLSGEERYRKLAMEYLRLGINGRRPYNKRARQSFTPDHGSSVPPRRCAREQGLKVFPRVPISLYTDRERFSGGDNGTVEANALLFRTWFGDQDYSISSSNELYERLILDWDEAWMDSAFIVPNQHCFTDPSYADVPTACMRSEARCLEEWLLSRLPDQLSYGQDGVAFPYRDEVFDGDEDEQEVVCLVIADRDAIVNGWLLVSAVNHNCEVLGRWRFPACSLISAIFWGRRSTRPDPFGPALYDAGFGWIYEMTHNGQDHQQTKFPVTRPPSLWWLAPDKWGFTLNRPSEKAPPP